MNQQIGKGSLCFSEAPFIIGTASVVGTKEGEGPLAEEFDCIGWTGYLGGGREQSAAGGIDTRFGQGRQKAGGHALSVCGRSSWTADSIFLWIKDF